jgi:hypothetical protein
MTTMRHVAVALAAAGLAVAGYGMDLCDYRTPTTNFLQGTLSFFYQHLDDPATPGPDTSMGWLTLDAQRQYITVREGLALGGSGELRFHNLSLARASVSTAGTLRQYVGAALPYFTFGGFEASLNTANPFPRLEAQAGLGYGRFYDVTPLAKALRIEERLLTRGIVPVALPNAVVLAMAEAIGQPDEAVPVGDRVTTVVRLVEEKLRGNLDAAAVLMIEEIITGKGQERFCGWTVQAGLAYELLDPRGGPRDFLFSLELDAALAPEPNSQLLLKAKIAGPYWIADQHTLTLDMTFDHRLNDITDFRARYTLRQDKPRGQAPAGIQSAVFHLRFNLGWIGVALQMEFSKLAEAPAWTQNVVITATANLW